MLLLLLTYSYFLFLPFSATSTTFGVSSSSYQESSNGATSSTYPSTPHHEGHGPTGQDATERSGSELSDGNATYSLEFGSETEEKKFIRKVVNAVQRSVRKCFSKLRFLLNALMK